MASGMGGRWSFEGGNYLKISVEQGQYYYSREAINWGTATIKGNMVYDMHIIISSVSIIRELKNHNEVHDNDVSWLGKDWNENVSFSVKKET